MLPYIFLSLIPAETFSVAKYSAWNFILSGLAISLILQILLRSYFRKNPTIAAAYTTNFLRANIFFLVFSLGMQYITHLIFPLDKYHFAPELAGLLLQIFIGIFSGWVALAHRKLLGLPDEGKPETFGTFFLQWSDLIHGKSSTL